jgi:hypothetical protein
VYNYILSSLELHWEKENQLISEKEFFRLREIEMKKYGMDKPRVKELTSEKSSINLLESDAAEPYIVIDPKDSSKLVATLINNTSTPPYDCPIFYSSDEGATWNQSSFDALGEASATVLSFNQIYGTADPVLAIDNNGTVHFVYLLSYEPVGGGYAISTLYAYSTDGGQNFIVPPLSDFVVVSGSPFVADFLDRIWLATDNSGGPNDGNVYLNGHQFFMGQAVYVKTPAATGFSLGPFAAMPGSSLSGNIEVDKNGTLHLSCFRFTSSGGLEELVYTRSIDQGQTWELPVVIDSGEYYLDIGEVPQIHNRENSAPSLTVSNDNVFLSWTNLDSNTVRSFYAYSQDGGTNWSGIQEFGPALAPGPNYHLMPCLAASGEKCSVSWFVVDSATLQGDYYLGEILDNGQTYGSASIISSGSTDFATTGAGTFYGDYNTIIRDSCIIYAIWADGQGVSPTTYVVKSNTCDSSVFLNEHTPFISGFSIESLHPNPALDALNINISTSKTTTLTIDLIDVQGKLIKSQVYSAASGKSSLQIEVSDLSIGTYLLKAKRKDGVFVSRRFVKR